MPAKRIILLLDGTWNDKDDGLADTNIVRLQSIIAKSLSNPTTSPPSLDPNSRASQKVRGFTSQGLENIVLYQRGVGTGAFDRIAGGVFGWGVPGNVRHSYKFLSYHYEDGDQIFVFGFSRGAYTARSLIGYISAIGLLTRTHCTPENELLAWQFYRTDPQDRLPGVWAKLTPYVHNRETLRIKCVGVFDTVGALGVPTRTLWRFNRASNEFHNVELSSITDVDLHAIAIDEHRVPFEATAWHKPKFKQFATCTEQVWFPGAHADVGGGYIDEEKRDSNSIALDDITLDWMLQRLKSYFSDFPFEQDVWKIINNSWSVAQQHEPHSERMYRSTPLSLRSIANYAVENLCSNECNMGRYRHADTIGEMVHVSALERLGKTVQTDERAHRYEPKNLIQILSRHQSNLQRRRSSVDPARYSRRGLDGGNF